VPGNLVYPVGGRTKAHLLQQRSLLLEKACQPHLPLNEFHNLFRQRSIPNRERLVLGPETRDTPLAHVRVPELSEGIIETHPEVRVLPPRRRQVWARPPRNAEDQVVPPRKVGDGARP
jgi:hypothetical protein